MKSTIKLDIDWQGLPVIEIKHADNYEGDVRDKLLTRFLWQYQTRVFDNPVKWFKVEGPDPKSGESNMPDGSKPPQYYYIKPIHYNDLPEEAFKMNETAMMHMTGLPTSEWADYRERVEKNFFDTKACLQHLYTGGTSTPEPKTFDFTKNKVEDLLTVINLALGTNVKVVYGESTEIKHSITFKQTEANTLTMSLLDLSRMDNEQFVTNVVRAVKTASQYNKIQGSITVKSTSRKTSGATSIKG